MNTRQNREVRERPGMRMLRTEELDAVNGGGGCFPIIEVGPDGVITISSPTIDHKVTSSLS
jgi:hypothetical protein